MKVAPYESGKVAVGKRSKRVGVVVAGLFLSACSLALNSNAISIYTLSPGGNEPALASAFPVGGVTLNSVTDPFVGTVIENGVPITLNGAVTSTVIQGDASNPYGGLTFTYQLMLNAISTDSSSEVTIGSYGGFATDVSYNATPGEILPSNFTRSGGAGSTVRFLFSDGGGVGPGDTSALIVVQTAAQNYTQANGGVIDSQTVNIATLAPVPEPGIASLLITGFGAFFVFRRRHSK